ncbi:hypothetical protein MRB53_030947 [Persea americana]|uniref:Uncharacterized protein n=1 Tax=Persea americana TaxID=3435 RepID=A0ACC2KMR6_PERAE|nr:hypothetical protein MRB53_030947 [Persea americana]
MLAYGGGALQLRLWRTAIPAQSSGELQLQPMEPLYRPFFTCPTEKQQYSQTLHTLESFFSPREVFFWWSFGLNHLCRVGLSYTVNSRAIVSWRRQVKKRRSVASVPGLCQLQRAWIYLKRARFPCLSPI